MASNLCQIVDLLTEFQARILQSLNKKFIALRNLAFLIAELADISRLIPDISKLIPVINIDLQVYMDLVRSCPWLNLPAVSTADVNHLQALVVAAYSNLAREISKHPWNRLGSLQAEMDKALSQAQGQLNLFMAQGEDFLRCLQQVCATVSEVEKELMELKNKNYAEEVNKFVKNFVEEGGQVLTEGLKAKYDQVIYTRDKLIELGADFKADYEVIKSKT
jgi:hypothetical protein